MMDRDQVDVFMPKRNRIGSKILSVGSSHHYPTYTSYTMGYGTSEPTGTTEAMYVPPDYPSHPPADPGNPYTIRRR